jgi:outer membrane immunogenic protein
VAVEKAVVHARAIIASVIVTAAMSISANADGYATTVAREAVGPSFAGAYIGLNAGAAWGSSDYSTNPGCPDTTLAVFCDSGGVSRVNGPAVANSGTGSLSSSGFTGGIQGGYNWQVGQIVFGGEGDFGAFNLGKSVRASGEFPSTFLGDAYTLDESMSTDWLITLRGRLGYTVTPQLLIYGTAGLALTDFKFSSGYSDNAIDATFPGGKGAASVSNVVTGWTIGGGGEWLIDSRWSIKAEYLYLDFGSTNMPVALSNTEDYTQTMSVDADLSAQVARVGVNYRP